MLHDADGLKVTSVQVLRVAKGMGHAVGQRASKLVAVSHDRRFNRTLGREVVVAEVVTRTENLSELIADRAKHLLVLNRRPLRALEVHESAFGVGPPVTDLFSAGAAPRDVTCQRELSPWPLKTVKGREAAAVLVTGAVVVGLTVVVEGGAVVVDFTVVVAGGAEVVGF